MLLAGQLSAQYYRPVALQVNAIAVAGPLLAELEERRVAYPVLQDLTE
ncbi:UNVERIFIED_ORG: hypothetical protein ABIB13_003621 [Arthrobacter sp. UYEF2]